MYNAYFVGTIPGPVLTGGVLDTSCDIWQYICDVKGSCLVYDRADMSWKLFVWWCVVKAVSCVGFFVGGRMYNPPSSETEIHKEPIVGTQAPTHDEKKMENGDYNVNFRPTSYVNRGFTNEEKKTGNIFSTHL